MNGQNLLDLSVLYVEDEAAPREEISLFLKRRIKKLITATNGEEGLTRFREDRPDLVVTDIRMPVMDGLKMVRAMRDEYKGIPIIVTTAYTETSYMVEAIDIAVDQYVIKPVDSGKLSAALEKCAEIIEYRRAHKQYLAERERLITDLQTALSVIKTLRGILPICSCCKKIRDDAGSWRQMESYIRDHSEAEFSHGYCPECAQKALEEIEHYMKHNSNTEE
jgi:YesN/AraC family two-component response regulator